MRYSKSIFSVQQNLFDCNDRCEAADQVAWWPNLTRSDWELRPYCERRALNWRAKRTWESRGSSTARHATVAVGREAGALFSDHPRLQLCCCCCRCGAREAAAAAAGYAVAWRQASHRRQQWPSDYYWRSSPLSVDGVFLAVYSLWTIDCDRASGYVALVAPVI